MKFARAALCGLLMAAAAAAQDPPPVPFALSGGGPQPADCYAELTYPVLGKKSKFKVRVEPRPPRLDTSEPGKVRFSGPAAKDGRPVVYKVTVQGIDFEKEDWFEAESDVTFTWTCGAAAPPQPPGGGAPPPAPQPAGVLYFVVVRPDGPASPDFARVMGLPEWGRLAAAGHRYVDKTVPEANALGIQFPPGTPLPCVVTLRAAGDRSKVVRGPAPLPADGAGVLKLPEGL